MKKKLYLFLITILLIPAKSIPQTNVIKQDELKERICNGWNTWNSQNVLEQVLLPYGLSIKFQFKRKQAFDEPYLKEALIGDKQAKDIIVKPSIHSLDGTYTELLLEWEEAEFKLIYASHKSSLVVSIKPIKLPEDSIKLVVSTDFLWNKEGCTIKKKGFLQAKFCDKQVPIYSNTKEISDPYVETEGKYLVLPTQNEVIISTDKRYSLEEAHKFIENRKKEFNLIVDSFNDERETILAIISGIGWNIVYDPKHDRIIPTVGRLWNREYGGYCLFGWDNFFLAYMLAAVNKDYSYNGIYEHLKGITEEGFIPNDNSGNGRKSWDRSQPPVGSIMVKEIYKKFKEKHFLEKTFQPLLKWNRWWWANRMNDGLLSYGSSKAKNPFREKARENMIAAKYESGMDDSPMYSNIVFNKSKQTMELQDVGLNSLYIADCKALSEIAIVLGYKDEANELAHRIRILSKRLDRLWNKKKGIYLNYNTKDNSFSEKLSPTLFYPMLAEIASNKQIESMINNHLNNPEEFGGKYAIPSIAKNDPDYPKQKYWKGAIWPPLNFLTYLSLRKAGRYEEASTLSQKSKALFLKEWKRMGYVSENYSAITGTGDDPRLSSDRFHSWGALMGIISIIDKKLMPAPETDIK
ncbi:MAG: trehalase family glycosidase [Hyphomicrobiales bacterium]